MPTKPPIFADDSYRVLRDGYRFAQRLRQERTGADDDRPIQTRLLGRPTLLVRGAEGVKLFYDPTRVKRQGAMPLPIRGSLFGKNSVHGMDGQAHLHRKQTFVRVCYADEQVERLKPMVEAEVREAMTRWRKHPESAYDAAVIGFGRAGMRWAGIQGSDFELDVQSRRLGDIVEGFLHLNLDHGIAWVNRKRTDAWCAKVIREQREGKRHAAASTSLAEWATHRELDGKLLDDKTAGIELQNTFRPHIAVARFVAFAVKALHDNPEWRQRIAEETAQRGTLVDGELATAFAQEVRRCFPFVPMLPAIAKKDFEFQGHQVEQGQWVMIDIPNTNTDPQAWERAEEFDPSRFMGVDFESIETFVPQGGAVVDTGHRCPGEKIAVSSLATMIAAISQPEVTIHEEGLDFPWTQMPTKPRSGGLVSID